MGITLNPREYFAIVRQLADHTDASTYYVQAVVRNSRTDEVLDTVQLTDQGDGRFTKQYQVPADVSGLGFFIDITTSVYSDSGYSSKASTYGDESETYLIYDRTKHGGGGHSVDVDYSKIDKMILKATGAIKIPVYEQKDVDLTGISKELSSLRTELKPEKIEKVDIGPILSKINELSDAIRSINIPEPKEVDLTPILAKLDDDKVMEYKKMLSEVNALLSEMKESVDKSLPEIKEGFTEAQEKMKEFLYILSVNSKATKENETIDTEKNNRIARLLGK